jgi:soluble lytic murein transglycosylase-like protein
MRAVTKNMRFVPLCGGFLIHGVSFAAAIVVSGCTSPTIYHTKARPIAPPQLQRAFNIALSWPSPADVDALKGAVLIRDGPAVDAAELAIARAILRTNPRLQPAYALLFAGATTRAARSHLLPAEFLGATLLQESAYDPQALSAAGAIGIAQFMPETAADVGVNPYDPFESIEAAAALIAGYVDAYRARYADPYSAALAAYNAGPFAVARYRGVPPYAETREYVALIYDRWARIVSYERTGGD